jgi:UDP-2-acetamido-3-amino-2,3-dideoxy-glucuronate N-acetyltransferase
MVRRGATIGANATVVAGLTIGQYALVGAGAVVTRDVPDFAIVYGNPARARGWACHCGATLGFVEETGRESGPSVSAAGCEACGSRYTLRDGVVEIVEKRMPQG